MRGRPPWILCLNMECPAKNGNRRKATARTARGANKVPRKKTSPRKKKAETAHAEAEVPPRASA